MSQLESRLPMFATKLPSYPKETKADSSYIIPLDQDTKISDYDTATTATTPPDKSPESPGNKSFLKTPTKISRIGKPVQKPSSLPAGPNSQCFYRPEHERNKQSPGMNNNVEPSKSVSSPSTAPKSTGQTNPKPAVSSKIGKFSATMGKSVQSTSKPAQANSSKPVLSSTKPNIASAKSIGSSSKPAVSPAKPITYPFTSSRKSAFKPVIPQTKTMSPTTLTKPVGIIPKSCAAATPTKNTTPDSPTKNLKLRLRNPGKTLTASKSEARLSVPSNVTMSAKRRSSQEIPTPKLSRSFESSKSDRLSSAKSESKLLAPSQSKSGLRKPLTFNKSLKPTKHRLRTAATKTEVVEVQTALSYPSLSKVLRLPEVFEHTDSDAVIPAQQTAHLVQSQSNISEECLYLNTCTRILSTHYLWVSSSIEQTGYEVAEVDITRSFSAPEFNFPNDLHYAKPFTAHVQPTQCFTYLQEAQPSSYKKKLVNSFTVSEQLSPTAETHARHIADSIPVAASQIEVCDVTQPWPNTDSLDGQSSGEISLIIPEPLVPTRSNQLSLDSITEADETPVLDDDPKIHRKKRPCKKAASFSLTQGIAREKVDELITQFKGGDDYFVSQPKHSTGLFSNLLNKIGGRRILSRPQESPPRARRSLKNPKSGSDRPVFGGGVIQRRKSSPALKTRETNAWNSFSSKSAEQTSPKHKPVVRDDSPIRNKEAYYGGPHYHTPVREQSPQPDIPLGYRQSPVVENVPQDPYEGRYGVNDRDDHMKFYNRKCPLSSLPPTAMVRASPYVQKTKQPARSNSLKMPHTSTSSHKSRNKQGGGAADDMTLTHFSPILRMGLPPCPDVNVNQAEQGNSAISKVTVGVRLRPTGETHINNSSYISSDTSRAQLILRDPSNESNIAPSCRRKMAAVPKLFAFDSVFGCDAMQMDICKTSLIEVLQSVLHGSDGCVISFGQSKTGKSQSMVGVDSSCADFGVIPTAISWLYHLIENQKNRTGARFAIRISALEIRGKNEQLADLLSDCAADIKEAHVRTSDNSSSDVRLTNTAVYGPQIENLSELRAPDAEAAGYMLDSALTKIHTLNGLSDSTSSHLLFTLHIYQHNLEARPSPGGAVVAGGRSRLHFIDVGQCAKSSSDGSALTLAALGSTITALLNGQRNFPHCESKLATLLKDSVGHPNCKTSILVHVSTQPSQYTETLQILQLAARIHRMKVRRKNKISSNSSDDTGSTSSNLRRRRGIRMGTSASLSDPDVSSSEQSVDTVIFVPGKHNRHTHRSPAYRAGTIQRQASAPAPIQPIIGSEMVNVRASPYNVAGAVKSRISDDETSSEGRRRMPRTNARAWPKANPCDSDSPNKKEYFIDSPPTVSRDQWHIPGTANPIPHHPQQYYSPQHGMVTPEGALKYPNQPFQQQKMDFYTQQHYAATHGHPPSPWISLAEYGGSPESIGQSTQSPRHVTPGHVTPTAGRQTRGDNRREKAGAPAQPETSKQELWVDGPTAFRKNIEGLTQNLQKDSWSPSRKHSRHHHGPERGEKPKHHHHHKSTPTRKHHHSNKHCYKCGDDIKKEEKTPVSKQETPSKAGDGGNKLQEPTVAVKPFVKDWVLRHSQNNTPVKSGESHEQSHDQVDGKLQLDSRANTRQELLEQELSEQDSLQLTVNLIPEAEFSVTSDLIADPPCSDNLMNDASDQDRQDDVHIDDSVSNISNVTADDRVGFESKEGSSIDDSLGEEMVEVCDAACQTEFTDSDAQSIQSGSPQDQPIKSSHDNLDFVDTLPELNSGSLNKRDATEAFLQATMLRKPDGASDPNLHKENSSPGDQRLTDSNTSKKIHSNTLPHSTHLKSPKPVSTATDVETNIAKPSTTDTDKQELQTIKLQPYLSSHKPLTSRHTVSTLPKPTTTSHSQSQKSPAKQNSLPKPSSAKTDSKLRIPALVQQHSSDSPDSPKSTSSPAKKSKGSKLPSLKFSGKSKESKSNLPTTPTTKSSDSSKKDKRSMIQPPSSISKPKQQNGLSPSLPHPSSLPKPSSEMSGFDAASSPYRQYVLPRPSYTTSDGCSDNSSCPSHPLAGHKYSVSSGYESMTLNSAEGLPQDEPQTADTEDSGGSQAKSQSTIGPWLNSSSLSDPQAAGDDSSDVTRRLRQRHEEERKMSEESSRRLRVDELLYHQDMLKREMMDAKNRLMVPAGHWNYELHVASQIERRNDEGYLEALEKETLILQRRVDACKSRIMLVTSIL